MHVHIFLRQKLVNAPGHARIEGLSQSTTLGEVVIELAHEVQHHTMMVVACIGSHHVRDACRNQGERVRELFLLHFSLASVVD